MIFYIPDEIFFILNRLQNNGFKGYVVGGALRDLLLGLEPRDFDITTNAEITDLKKLFDKVIESGKGHDTIGILTEYGVTDITRFRGKMYTDLLCSLKEDLGMRDFTINALAYDPLTFTLVDPFSSYSNLLSDIVIIRSNDPKSRFEEDPLRTLRIISLIARLYEAGKKWKIERKTLTELIKVSGKLSDVAPERINKELTKILLSEKSDVLFRLIYNFDIINTLIPEITNKERFNQKMYLLKVLRFSNIELKLSALMYSESKHDAENILTRLKFSSKIIKRVLKILEFSSLQLRNDDYDLRQFVSIVGKDLVQDILIFKEAINDLEGKSDNLKILKNKIDKFLKEGSPISVSDLAVSGNDIMSVLQIEGGKIVGEILKELLELVLKHPDMNKKSILLKYVKTKLKPGNNPGSKRN
jgi:tRNA nucleotidyltransferase (CCA-adding enzyme)